MSERSLDDTLERAIAFAKLTTPDEYNALPGEQAHQEVEGLYDPEIAKVHIDKKSTWPCNSKHWPCRMNASKQFRGFFWGA